jgi:hypothetical protein
MTIISYKLVWTHRDRNGDWEYGYNVTFSDGSTSFLRSLPWDRLGNAVDLDKVA